MEDLVGKGPPESGGCWSASEVRRLLRSTAEALEGLHAAGIAHCDVKESNIALARAGDLGSAKLIDMGCVHDTGEPQDFIPRLATVNTRQPSSQTVV